MSRHEEKVIRLLKKEKIKFVREKSFPDLMKGRLRFDFYIPNLYGAPTIIEVDGPQHFSFNKHFFQTQSEFNKYREHDRRKNSYCLAKGIILYRVPWCDMKQIQSAKDIFQDKYKVKTRWHNDKLKFVSEKNF